MSEWSIVQSWNGCVQRCTPGSNPGLCAKKCNPIRGCFFCLRTVQVFLHLQTASAVIFELYSLAIGVPVHLQVRYTHCVRIDESRSLRQTSETGFCRLSSANNFLLLEPFLCSRDPVLLCNPPDKYSSYIDESRSLRQ